MTKLARFLKPHSRGAFFAVALLFLQSMTDLIIPTIMSGIVDDGMIKADSAYIYKFGALMLVVALFGAACSFSSAFFSSKTTAAVCRDLRETIFKKTEKYSLDEFGRIGASSLITRVTNDITQLQALATILFRFVLLSPLMFIGGVAMALTRDIGLSKVLYVSAPVLALAMVALAKFITPLFDSMQKNADRLNLVVRESLTGMRVIRAFNKIERDAEKFSKASGDLMRVTVKSARIMAAMQPFLVLILNGAIMSIIWIGGNRVNDGTMQVGEMMAFLQYAGLILSSIIMIAMVFIIIPRARVSAVRVLEALEMEPNISDPPSNAKILDSGAAGVEFKNVTFGYPNAETPVLKNVSFTADPGETTAIVGGVGSGKSALLNLIPRLHDVTEGSALVGGVDTRETRQSDLREKIGFVTQTPVIFSGTVAENIRIGKKGASDEEVEQAAAAAQALEFIKAMPGGFDADMAQGGANISGGQKQRIAIARAFIRKPEIYLFDDCFSALDVKTDSDLRAALKKETADKTVIIVSQRVSTIKDADKIIVLDEGKIAGVGRHKELLASCDVYRSFVSSQLSEEEMS
ncbi:MAG: ABC transporter ATP-binding protein/permease [Clostridiales bacterium]|jgi:ATP-binding cassette subfamily B protein|nr:ABC transporter ATP-binding protein/permease [Clostridiales bacterium]